MFGDTCTSCHQSVDACSCGTPEPLMPAPGDEPCPDWVSAGCIFWKASPIEDTPINADSRLTAIILYLVQENKTLKQRLAAANIP